LKNLRKRAIAALVYVFAAWSVVGFGAGVVSWIAEAREYKAGLDVPEPSTGKTTPLQVCRYHGPCRTVYVTESAAKADKVETSITFSWLAAAVAWLAIMVPLGFAARRKKSLNP
jgi:hypothetical protein